MNIIGIFLWIAVAGTSLHYWDSYARQHQFEVLGSERDFGLVLGSLCVFTALAHVADSVFCIRLYFDKAK